MKREGEFGYKYDGVTGGQSEDVRARDDLTTLLVDEGTEVIDDDKGGLTECQIRDR